MPTFVPTPRIERLLNFASAVSTSAWNSMKTRENGQLLATVVPSAKYMKIRRFLATTPNDLVTYGQMRSVRLRVRTRTVPRTVPTQRHPGFFHRGPRVVFLGMHISFCD